MNTCEVMLDLDKSRKYRRYKPVVLRRGEVGACVLRATVTDHGVAVDTEGTTPLLVAKVRGGGYCRQSGTWDDGAAVIEVDERYFASVVGHALTAYVEIRDDAGELIATTQDFPLTTLDNADGGELPESYDTEIERVIQSASDDVDDAIERADTAVDDAVSRADDAVDDAVSRADDAAQRATDAAQAFSQGTVVVTDEQIDAMFAD